MAGNDNPLKMEKEKLFICTNCGDKIEELYKQFGSVALKLTKCVSKWHLIKFLILKAYIFQENCNQVADKYVEYDLINIIIDLILFKIVAVRHFLFNSTYRVSIIITYSSIDNQLLYFLFCRSFGNCL